MSVNTAGNGLKTILRILFGSPDLPPLGRKAFIREAIFVFLVRWVGTECASALLLWIAGVDFTEGVSVWWPIPIGLAIFLVFLVPYIRVMHRRLLAINFPFPSAFVWGAMLLYLTLELTFPTDNIYYLEGAGLMFFLSVYALLIPWPDSRTTRKKNDARPGFRLSLTRLFSGQSPGIDRNQ